MDLVKFSHVVIICRISDKCNLNADILVSSSTQSLRGLMCGVGTWSLTASQQQPLFDVWA